ncbi:MAG TPA: PEP-CTERM sorting domain-containing protein [Verrucomicrobiae bacterium]|nr:PEP-CTERM sorting domain-containing protein [Verrucomicrobiae bacterium]
MASLILVASGAVSHAQYTITFNSAADTSSWTDAGQTVHVTSSFVNDTPSGQSLSTGALGFSGTYGPGATFGGLTYVFPDINALQYADLTFWVKQEGTPDQYGQIQSIQFNLSNYGTGLYSTATVQPNYSGSGWQQFVVPISSFGQQSLLNDVNRINLYVFDGNYTASTTMNIAFSNIAFTNPVPEPSSLFIGGAGAGLFGFVSLIRRKINFN